MLIGAAFKVIANESGPERYRPAFIAGKFGLSSIAEWTCTGPLPDPGRSTISLVTPSLILFGVLLLGPPELVWKSEPDPGSGRPGVESPAEDHYLRLEVDRFSFIQSLFSGLLGIGSAVHLIVLGSVSFQLSAWPSANARLN